MTFGIGRLALAASLAAATCGCNTLTTKQTSRFVDDDGNFLVVEYQTSKKPHVSKFISPGNNSEQDFPTNLRVEVELPDGESFAAWQTMNLIPNMPGTLYKSTNGKWLCFSAGLSCSVWHQTEDKTDYYEVFRGGISETPKKKQ